MGKKWTVCMALLMMACWITPSHSYEALTGPTGVLLYDKDKAYNGYTLFSPTVNCKETYLIDMDGNVVHTWKTQYTPGLYSELLPNGNLLIGGVVPQDPGFCGIGGVGGVIQELDWNGNVVWEYKLFEPGKAIQHHTFKRLPNGNTMILAWEAKSKKEALAKGRNPKTIPDKPVKSKKIEHNEFWVDFVREVDRNGKTVWEWHAWDHIGKGKDKLDINYTLPEPVGSVYPNFDWSHFNTIDYIPATDTVVLNSRNLAEFYFINHKTGKIEYRWGNPTAYDPKAKKPGWYDNADQKIFGPHCPTVLENGNILLFDNGSERPESRRSAAVEMNPKTGEVVWSYESKHSNSFNSYRQGAVQRLPNGNTLITATHGGHIFEVTPDKKIVWEYVNPVYAGQAKCVATENEAFAPSAHLDGMTNFVHRAYRYAPDYPGLKGKDLSKKTSLGDCPIFYKVWKKGGCGYVEPTAGQTAKPAKPQTSKEKVEEEEQPTMPGY